MGKCEFVGEDILVSSPIELTIMEIHALSYGYHWGFEECWNMPVSKRGVFVDQLRKQYREESKSYSNSGNSKSSYKESKR